MVDYRTPGVYFESFDRSRGRLTAIRTDVAAFIGLAERGPLDEPVAVESWQQFRSRFGDFIPAAYLAYAVRAFFENGGRRCYVVRVAGDNAQAAGGDIPGRNNQTALTVRAATPGRWGNRLSVRLSYQHAHSTRFDPTASRPAQGNAAFLQVETIVGFTPETLVRLSQPNPGGKLREAYRFVQRVDVARRRLYWRDPLPVSGADGFDLAQPVELETVAYALSLYEAGQLRQVWEQLSPVPDHPRYVEKVLGRTAPQGDEPQLITVEDHTGSGPLPDRLPDVGALTAGRLTLSGGRDGLADLQVGDFTGLPAAPERRGLRTLEQVDEVALLAIPDILIRPAAPRRHVLQPPPPADICRGETPGQLPPLPVAVSLYKSPGGGEKGILPAGSRPAVIETRQKNGETWIQTQLGPRTGWIEASLTVTAAQPPEFSNADIFAVQQALVEHCRQQQDRFALLDPPMAVEANPDPSEVLAWRQRFDTSYAALYYPWLLAPDPLRLQQKPWRAIPPSGHVAGIIARTDLAAGVHQAPANAVLNWATAPVLPVDDAWQAVLNPAHVNCVRPLRGRGLRLYGARTLSSDPAWRFVNVRRLLMMIEESLALALQWAVFEPNTVYVRQTISLTVSSFLKGLWQQNALAGATAEAAYFVRCDEENNPPEVVEAGQLIVDVGVAPVSPAEFVIFRIGRVDNALSTSETAASSPV